MTDYRAPLQDMLFLLRDVAPLGDIARLPGCEEMTLDLAKAILEEAGKFATGVLSPLNAIGDREGARWNDGEVRTASGWREAYAQFIAGGWNALSCDPAHGGQGLPRLVSALVEEMWNGANVAFALCPMLPRGAIEALEIGGSPAQQGTYLSRMVSGEWTGTMNLTEPQAGSASRWQLPPAWPEDLRHLRRTRPDGQHRPPGAGPHPRRAGGRERHLAVRRAQAPGQ